MSTVRFPGEVNEEVRKKAIGDDEVITCRPADLIAPELEKYKEETEGVATCEEDVLSYALFPQVATKFFEERKNGGKKDEPAKKADSNGVRTIYVQDLGE